MKWNNIRTKLIIFMLLPTVACIIASMVISYHHTSQSLRDRAIKENTNLLYQGSLNVQSMLQELNRISLIVYSDSNFYRLLNAGYDDMAANIRIYSSLNYIYTSMDHVFQVYLYGIKDGKATLITQSTPKRWQEPEPYKNSVVTGTSPVSIESTHPSHSYGLSSPLLVPDTEEQVFTLHRRIEQIPTDTTLGYLSIDVKMTALTDILEQLYESGQEKLYLIDAEGNVIYSDNTSIMGEPMNQGWYSDQIVTSKLDSGSFEQNNALFVYQSIQEPGTDWTLIKEIPNPNLLREANEAAKINMLLLAVSLLLITTAIVVITIRITAPIRQLMKYMNQVQSGNLQVDIKATGNDEIGVLTNRFRDMMHTINNLILREYKLELSSKTNQLRALQAQINPHFMNNTLQIIGTLALELKVPQIYSLLSALAKMMHYSMHNDNDIVRLEEEFQHVNAYIQLQKERYENVFEFHAELNDDIKDMDVPKMILQPMVENYFKHGFDPEQEGAWIGIRAYPISREHIKIVVENNGRHISSDKLQELRKELAESNTESEIKQSLTEPDHRVDSPGPGIGLANVLSRTRLACGDDAYITIDNLPGQGTRITLNFKYRTGSETP
ncbi:sensor histidine kinase [Neobacillus mesonae]|nr:sensor histidine kinase [Neobacillus mesonae]